MIDANERKKITGRIRYESGVSLKAFCEEQEIDYNALQNALRSMSGISLNSQGHKAMTVLRDKGFITKKQFDKITKNVPAEDPAVIKARNIERRKRIGFLVREKFSMSLKEYAESKNISLTSFHAYLSGSSKGVRAGSIAEKIKKTLIKDCLINESEEHSVEVS